jgi:hypothetical protein
MVRHGTIPLVARREDIDMPHPHSDTARRDAQRRPVRLLLGGCLVAALVASACTDSGGSSGSGGSGGSSGSDTASSASGVSDGGTEPSPQPTAPDSDRVDLDEPTFSDPTSIDNPLFPTSELESAILLGNDEGHPLRIETVLLPENKVIDVDGQEIETRALQFVAFLDGRIHEVALDWYAQDDDGNVWYFGEDVFNYEDGAVADTDGTWIAGEDGPPGMIMPADPQVGEAFRPENIPDFVFEEVVVKSVDVTVDGPRGPVEGAIVGTENHLIEGHYEDKTFAPGYGEFRSGVGGNLEALALGVPTDAQGGGVPAELDTIARGAAAVFAAAGDDDWNTAAATLAAMNDAWSAHRANVEVPPLLAVQMDEALDALAGDPLQMAVEAHNPEGARNAALDVAMATFDLQLQYRPPIDVDLARFRVWADQLMVDSASDEADAGNIAGDVTSLEWVWDRIGHAVDTAAARDIEAQLDDLRAAADDEDVAAAADAAPRLVESASNLAVAR